MITVEMCRGCGRPLFTHRVANLVVRLETDALDAQKAVAALIDGRDLWTVTPEGCTPASTAVLGTLRSDPKPHIVQEHRCRPDALQHGRGARQTPAPGPSVQAHPRSPSVGRTAPLSGPQTEASSVRSAEHRPTDPLCDRCGRPCAPGTYWGFQVGDRFDFAEHVDECGND